MLEIPEYFAIYGRVSDGNGQPVFKPA